jgi:Ca2+-transporting ATPase
MQVVDIYTDMISYDVAEKDSMQQISQTLLEISIGCNKAGYGRDSAGKEQLFGDPTEIGLLQFAEFMNCKKSDLELQFPAILEFPFDSERKRMSIVRDHGTFIRSYVK